MDKVSVYEGKARFSELVERAESGRSTVITKRGRVVAKIIPARAPGWDRAAVLDEAETFRKRANVKGSIDIRKLIEEGERGPNRIGGATCFVGEERGVVRREAPATKGTLRGDVH